MLISVSAISVHTLKIRRQTSKIDAVNSSVVQYVTSNSTSTQTKRLLHYHRTMKNKVWHYTRDIVLVFVCFPAHTFGIGAHDIWERLSHYSILLYHIIFPRHNRAQLPYPFLFVGSSQDFSEISSGSQVTLTRSVPLDHKLSVGSPHKSNVDLSCLGGRWSNPTTTSNINLNKAVEWSQQIDTILNHRTAFPEINPARIFWCQFV